MMNLRKNAYNYTKPQTNLSGLSQKTRFLKVLSSNEFQENGLMKNSQKQ